MGRPKRSDLVSYEIVWNWGEEFANKRPYHDIDVMAVSADQAINKLIAKLKTEYDIKRSDVVILEVYRI